MSGSAVGAGITEYEAYRSGHAYAVILECRVLKAGVLKDRVLKGGVLEGGVLKAGVLTAPAAP